ncbi:MAG: BACON domain-containing protein [Desulfosoma sp.]|uniref:BACON domain-containing protein n=1 Tax=Desulfosoma sp. TaxID=2603217 RepID=UPI0040497531
MKVRAKWMWRSLGCALLCVFVVAPWAVWAQDEEGSDNATLVVAPSSVNLGTFRLLPGQSLEPGSFTVTVTGGPKAADNQTSTFFVSCDAVWLKVVPTTGDIPGSFTVTVSISKDMEGSFTGTITVVSGLDPSKTAEVTVSLTVVRTPGNLLTVSPAQIQLDFTTADLSARAFPVLVRNADPSDTTFLWSAASAVPWLILSPSSGTGNTTATLTVDPTKIPVLDDDSYVEGKVVFSSSLSTEPVELVVRARVIRVARERLSVYPGYLFWSLERTAEGSLDAAFAQTLFVIAQEAGWFATVDVPFLNVSVNPDLEVPGSTGRSGSIQVTPVAEALQVMGYGRFTGRITVSNVTGDAFRVIPVTVDVRRPGEPISGPPVMPVISQATAGFLMVETVDSAWLELILAAPRIVARYPTQAACAQAQGRWMDPDGMPGSLDETCSLDEKIYVLLSFPDAQPGTVYTLSAQHPNGFAVAFQSGVKQPGADDFYYAAGPIGSIPLGPVRLLGLQGRIIVSSRVGKSLADAAEVQRAQINVRTPEGTWLVSETYQGAVYDYGTDRALRLQRDSESYDFVGTWGDTPVICRPGDGMGRLYVLEFWERGVAYRYEITSLTSQKMAGRWTFAYGTSWEAFEATRVAFR